MPRDDEDTIAYAPAIEPEEQVVAESFDEVGIEIGALTRRGKIRFNNEDQFAVVRLVERQLPKLNVEGSNPFTRFRRSHPATPRAVRV